MNSEKTTDSEVSMNIEESIEGEETPLETEPEPKQQDRRPLWMIGGLVVVVLALLACCVLAGGAFLAGRGTKPPISEATATVEQPAPPEVPTVPPPQAPTAEPPPEEPPVPEHLPAEPGEGGQPCAPLALGLVVVPLLVVRKRGRR